MRRALVLPLLSALALGGCTAAQSDDSGDFPKGPKRDVARAVEDFADAAQRRDWKEVCDDRLAPALAQRLAALAKGTCADRIEDSLRDVPQSAWDVDVRTVDVTGATAQAQIKTDRDTGGDALDVLQLTQDRDGWGISGVGAALQGG